MSSRSDCPSLSPSTILCLSKGSLHSKCSCQTQLLSANIKAELDVSQTKIDNLEWVKKNNNNEDRVYIYAYSGQCSAAKFALVILITQLKDNEQLGWIQNLI